ncbi:MAG TPA: hypothetical protein VME46_18730 [Acidimicrobiales bacterium]|nr:hypothetical protein [Acidimicrobiales bacterium]
MGQILVQLVHEIDGKLAHRLDAGRWTVDKGAVCRVPGPSAAGEFAVATSPVVGHGSRAPPNGTVHAPGKRYGAVS